MVLWEDSPCQSRGDTQQTEEGWGFPYQRERECAGRLLSLCQVSITAPTDHKGEKHDSHSQHWSINTISHYPYISSSTTDKLHKFPCLSHQHSLFLFFFCPTSVLPPGVVSFQLGWAVQWAALSTVGVSCYQLMHVELISSNSTFLTFLKAPF